VRQVLRNHAGRLSRPGNVECWVSRALNTCHSLMLSLTELNAECVMDGGQYAESVDVLA